MKSEAQTINKPSQVYKKSNNEVMRSYPEHYYKEIVKFLRNSNNWYFMSDKDALLNDKQEEKDKQYCYKPYRTIHNY